MNLRAFQRKEAWDLWLAASVKSHVNRPSFMKASSVNPNSYEMLWDGSKYSVTLTDSNNVLGNFSFSSNTAGITISASGNKLTISATTPPTSNVQITATKNNATRKATVIWTDYTMSATTSGQIQDLITYGADVSDPVSGFVNLRVSAGSLAIVKTTTNNGGAVSGFQFRVTKNGSTVGTYTSDASGKINIPNLAAGWYKVEEINLSSDFVAPTPNPVDVEIKGGQTATVSFTNVKKQGVITVKKSNANPTMGDYSLSGAVFEVRNAGGSLVDTITTNESSLERTSEGLKCPWSGYADRRMMTSRRGKPCKALGCRGQIRAMKIRAGLKAG
ncbi:MAG: hypothetical protein LBL82_06165 [Oscillospiraceae bacterium]|jgi:hypothetical protein|nr:hypothetical protein [Oscillospiraceae bacterium]